MTERDLYLHEIIDIVGSGQYEYMDHSAKEPTNMMPGMLKLQGNFYILGAGGGPWPKVVNIWDVGEEGWDGFGRNIDRLNLKRRSAFYDNWWDEGLKWRTGGHDRLCGGVPGNPSTAEIEKRGVKGSLFVHQLLTVRPGTPLDYLEEVVAQQVPAWREHGHEPTGIYEVLNNQHEVIVIWATTIPAHIAMRRSRDRARGLISGTGDSRLVDWERTAARFVTGGETVIMTPAPGSVYGPADWEDASLDEWLAPDDDA